VGTGGDGRGQPRRDRRLSTAPASGPARLERRLGTGDAVIIGLGAMLGAGVFAALAPATRAAGSGVLIALVLAGVVAYCNATSSARLAALYPESGGSYTYGRRRLGRFWGYLAGWAFVVGKTASCAAMALTFGAYAAPGHARVAGLLAVLVLTALSCGGVQRSALVTRVIVALVLVVLAAVVIGALAGGTASLTHVRPFPGAGPHGILQAAGLLFFAFAGYARIATLGEEVRAPERTIPRAIALALAVTFATYLLVGLAALLAVGAPALAGSSAPLHTAVAAVGWLGPVVRVGAAVAALGSLLALLLGVSRTGLAMARDRYLPHRLSSVSARGVPARAELAVGAVVGVLVATTDLRGAIGFSSFGVLGYYAIANASAATLSAAERRPPRWLPPLGLLGCAALALSLPLAAAAAGAGVLAFGALLYPLLRRAQPASRERAG
jgi:APA family basic amino acid/polyamine antiporter